MKCNSASPAELAALLPERNLLAAIWKYLASTGSNVIRETPMCLCRKIVRKAGIPMGLSQLLVCLDIFADVNLLTVERQHKNLIITLAAPGRKADLNTSRTMQMLQGKES
jgi:hypothetical protein